MHAARELDDAAVEVRDLGRGLEADEAAVDVDPVANLRGLGSGVEGSGEGRWDGLTTNRNLLFGFGDGYCRVKVVQTSCF